MHTYKYNHWITDTEQPTTAKAFTYTIWFPSLGLRYIGYKTINSRSKWLNYTSSSRPVKKLINTGHTAVYRIVKWFDNTNDARAEEVSAMTSYNVTRRSEYLNQCIGGVTFSTAGQTISAEHRAKIGAAHKGKTISDESRAKMSAANKGKKRPSVSDETRAKLSAALKGRVFSDETKAKIGAANKGRKLPPRSDETCAKLSSSKQIGLYVTPLGTFETRKEASIAHGCALSTIIDRCKSTSPQFDNWAFFKY